MPSVYMMVFMSIYYVVDGYFIANYVGKEAFAAVNMLIPAIVIPSSIAFMLSAGGSAVVATTLGEGKAQRANAYFSLFIYLVMGVGLLLTFGSELILPYFLRYMGAEAAVYEAGMQYGFISLATLMPFMLEVMFQALWSVAEKPRYGLYMTVGSGLTNIALDYLFIVNWHWGIEGAAIASAISQLLGGLVPVIYFAGSNKSLLRLGRAIWSWSILSKASYNGLSEMMSSLSASVLGILYNIQLMRYIGTDGVAAYGVMLYANGIFESIYFGYGMGASAIISYNFGARKWEELRSVFRKSLVLVGFGSISIAVLAIIFAPQLTYYFVGYDTDLWELTTGAFSIYALSFLVAGYNGFGSAFFTAINNGTVSGLLSFTRILLFQAGAVLLLPWLWGIDGIWWSVVVAEGFALVMTAICWRIYFKNV